MSVLLPLDRLLCCWTVSHREYHPSRCQFYYHWIDTSAVGLLVTESIIRPVVSVTTTVSTPLLVDYYSQRVSTVQLSVFLSRGRHLCWWTISHRVSTDQLSVLLLLDQHLCWWIISHREYHPSCFQCYYHSIDTTAGGLLVTESIIPPVVSASNTGSTPLLLDY